MSLIGILGAGFGVAEEPTPPTVVLADMRDRATQDQLLYQTVRRLRSQIKGFSESNCIVTDQEQPEQWPSGNIVCTVCVAPGRFPEALFAGGGTSTLTEVAALKVSVYARCKLDKPPAAEAWIIGSDKGLVSKYKPAVLRALLCEEKNGEVEPWEPCDADGVKLLRNQLSPISCTAPTPTANGDFLGITLAFDTTFDWKL
jgi:hypothetical protein